MDVNKWMKHNMHEMYKPECDKEDITVLSQTVKQKCSLYPRSVPNSVDASELCAGMLISYLSSDLKFELKKANRLLMWKESPQYEIRHDDPLYKHLSKIVLAAEFIVIADFCADAAEDVPAMVDAFTATYKDRKFDLLLSSFPIEFRSSAFDRAYRQAMGDAAQKLTPHIGTDLQRNVSVLMPHVMKRLAKNKVIAEEDFYSSEKKMAASHTLDMIRCYVKLYCIERTNESCVKKDDCHEIWKSLLLHLAMYAGVNVSMTGETKRYYLMNGDRSITVKADMEIMMSPCKPNFANVLTPRIIAEVYKKKEKPVSETEEILSGIPTTTKAKEILSGNPTTTKAKEILSGNPTTTKAKEILSGNPTTANANDNHCFAVPKLNAKSDLTQRESDHCSQAGSAEYQSDESFKNAKGPLQTELPDCLCEEDSDDVEHIKSKLFGQHAAQLLTMQQALEYCSEGDIEENVGKPVIGLFMYNEKIVFTKLTGNDDTGRKLTVSNWCLKMDRFIDRMLLMVFISSYCTVPFNAT